MRVVLHLLSSATFSGAENVACELIELYADDESLTGVYCSPDGSIREVLAERGIRYKPLDAFDLASVRTAIRSVNPQVIHAHDRRASIMASRATHDIPIVSHMHINNNRGFLQFCRNALWAMRRAQYSKIIWVSKATYEKFPFRGALCDKSVVLKNCISAESVLREATAACRYDSYDVVYVGRLSSQKNPEKLMTTLAMVLDKCPEARIAIAGDGEYSAFVASYIQERGLSNIEYFGYVSDAPALISKAKCIILTSDYEGLPMVILESQVLGVPVISTPVDGVNEIIQHGVNGFTACEPDELADFVVLTITRAELRRQLSEGSLLAAKRFTDMAKYKETVDAIYQNAVG